MPNPKRGEEIERVFKVRRLPKQIGSCPRDNIVQGYLAIEDEGPEVRLRKSGDHYYETFKGSGLLQRQELEIELSREQFDALWPGTEGRRLEKTRYRVSEGAHTIEVDVFRGALNGLVLAEIEFVSTTKSAEFQPPDWLAEEVTDDRRYKNNNLARNGAPGGESPDKSTVIRPR